MSYWFFYLLIIPALIPVYLVISSLINAQEKEKSENTN
ncbi:MAG: hypothetical protein ACD_70C00107G0009 [uncultured bacterium]|nr:MAG: hypothetical protein ACD_70C00107G0009 [uncultured bacterium]